MSLSELKFTFGGVSCDAHGVEVLRLPALARPPLRMETVTIPGRSGSLHMRDGAYEEILGTCDCYLPYDQGRTVSGIAAISSWLSGSGWWTQSDRPGRRFQAHITDEIDFQSVLPGFADRIFSIPVWLEPYAYHTSNSDITLTSAGAVENPGTAAAEPKIIVFGSGDINLQVGSSTVLITGLAASPGRVTIDTPARMAYQGTNNRNGIISLPGGTWPTLATGSTAISWTGSVTKIVITPNWRDI